MTLRQGQDWLQGLADRLHGGCGNHGCVIRPPHGLGTNASCRCRPKDFARDLRQLAAALDTLQGWEET